MLDYIRLVMLVSALYGIGAFYICTCRTDCCKATSSWLRVSCGEQDGRVVLDSTRRCKHYLCCGRTLFVTVWLAVTLFGFSVLLSDILEQRLLERREDWRESVMHQIDDSILPSIVTCAYKSLRVSGRPRCYTPVYCPTAWMGARLLT